MRASSISILELSCGAVRHSSQHNADRTCDVQASSSRRACGCGRPVPHLGAVSFPGYLADFYQDSFPQAAAFTLGFVFIGLQYLSSRQFINVNWGAFSSSYDRFITSRAGPPSSQGGNRLARVWTGFIDFVSANVQQRATFVAGVVLGLRLG